MPVPWEAIIPLGIMVAMFTVAGSGLHVIRTLENEGKPLRHTLDVWERAMLQRDFRLTGTNRQQRSWPIAPEEFKTNSKYGVEPQRQFII